MFFSEKVIDLRSLNHGEGIRADGAENLFEECLCENPSKGKNLLEKPILCCRTGGSSEGSIAF